MNLQRARRTENSLTSLKSFSFAALLVAALVATAAGPALGQTETQYGIYFQGWDDPDLNLAGWTPNTAFSTLVRVGTGGNAGGYVRAAGSLSGATSELSAVSGNYAAAGINQVSFDLKPETGVLNTAVFRVRFRDSTFNGWHIPLDITGETTAWRSYVIRFDPTWSDAQAQANGWIQEDDRATFSQTMAEVYHPEIRLSGNSDLSVGIDNFRLAGPGPALLAKNDTYSTNEDAALSIAASGVLANDTGGSLTAELVALPEHGSVTLNVDGSFIYAPNPEFNGLDSFLYVAKQGETAESNIAMVTITVGAVNDPPFFNVIADQYPDAPVNVDRTVDVTGLSPGPANEAGQTLEITAVSSNTALISNLTITGEGSTRTLTYTRVSTNGGTATITVTAKDNGGTQNGGADTHSQTFDITLDAAEAVHATVTTLTPNADPTKAPKVGFTVTAGPIKFDGTAASCYRFFPPRAKPGQPFNVIPSSAKRVPEAPPWRICGTGADGLPLPGCQADTTEIRDIAQTFSGEIDLSEWGIDPVGTTNLTYVSIVKDLEEQDPNDQCPRIWTGVKPAGSITLKAGDKVGVKNTVTLKTFDTVTKVSTSTRLPLIPIRVFDIKDPEFLAVAGDAIKTSSGGEPKISFDLLSAILGKIYEADKGRIGTCQTDDGGMCLATQPAPAYDLIVAKFFDDDTGRTVYVGTIKTPKNFVNGIASADIVIVKLFKNGVFDKYAPAILQLVQ